MDFSKYTLISIGTKRSKQYKRIELRKRPTRKRRKKTKPQFIKLLCEQILCCLFMFGSSFVYYIEVIKFIRSLLYQNIFHNLSLCFSIILSYIQLIQLFASLFCISNNVHYVIHIVQYLYRIYYFIVDVFPYYLLPQHSVHFYIYCLRSFTYWLLQLCLDNRFIDLLLKYSQIIIDKCPRMSLYDICINIISLNILDIFIIIFTNIGFMSQ